MQEVVGGGSGTGAEEGGIDRKEKLIGECVAGARFVIGD